MNTDAKARALKITLQTLILIAALVGVTILTRWLVVSRPGAAAPVATATPLPTSTELPSATPTDTPSPTATSTPTPSPTATATPTARPTATAVRTPTLAPTSFPTIALPTSAVILGTMPIATQPLTVPAAMPLIEQPEGTINLLVLGSDVARIDTLGRTDVIVIASINPQIPSVSLLSVPRDFYAWIPTHGFDKINTAFVYGEKEHYPAGGPGLIKATIEYNFGIPIHYYMRVGFDGFVMIVDALGGVDVAVECPLSDTFPDPSSPTGQTDVDWMPGIHHLDGKHALWYSRSRWSTSDFDRNRRQQQVLRAMYQQVMTLDIIPKLPQLWGALKETASTDMGLNELLYLANIASKLDTMNIKSRFVGRNVVRSWTAPNGGAVLVPDYALLGPLVAEAMAPPASGRGERLYQVEVWNATPYQGLGFVAAERLRWEGFAVVSVAPAQGGPYHRTQIVDFTTTSKGSPLPTLIALYKRRADDVVAEPTEDRVVDFRVILGSDYDPCAATKLNANSN